ncbi:TrmH family RNA methyltransferase [Chloroflexota bacterium]|nr:TrmH family RNA methyltransferase [Chloroflexota bacterium]
MTTFEIRQCTDAACRLRIPLDPSKFSGAYCPRCGAPMTVVVDGYQNPTCSAVDLLPRIQLSVLLDNIRSAHNVGAIFRTGDGVGLQHLYLCGFTPTPADNPAVAKTALGAEERLKWSHHRNALDLVDQLQDEAFKLVALECTAKATPIYRFKEEPPDKKAWLLVVGNERAGVDPGLLERCDLVLNLPMTGEKNSLNVAAAFAAAAYWLSYA